jgi:hypothetical protein
MAGPRPSAAAPTSSTPATAVSRTSATDCAGVRGIGYVAVWESPSPATTTTKPAPASAHARRGRQAACTHTAQRCCVPVSRATLTTASAIPAAR